MPFSRFVAPLAGVVLLGCASVLHAGVNSWTLNGPGGGAVSAVAFHPTNPSIVLVSTGNGMYRSTDGGVNWSYVGDGGYLSNILFDPANPNRVFAAGNVRAGIYRSDDAGATFAVSAGPPNATPYRLTIANDSTMYVGDHTGRIFRSTNLGLNWTEVGHSWTYGDFVLNALAVDPANSNVVITSIIGIGTYRSTDGGLNWGVPLANSPGGAYQNETFRLAFKPGDSSRVLGVGRHGLYLSSDNGASWTQLVANATWLDVAFDPSAANNVIGISYPGQIERSSDGGASWPAGQRGAQLAVPQTMALAVAPSGRIVVATSDGPMFSANGGDSFTLNVTNINAEGVRDFATAADNTIYIAMNPGPFGVFRRVGTRWAPVDNAELRSSQYAVYGIDRVAVAPGDSNRLYALASGSGLMSSLDGGQTWSAPHPQFQTGQWEFRGIAFDPANAAIAYVHFGNAGLWRTTNQGATWAQVSGGIPGGGTAFAIDPADSQILYMGDFFGFVFKSTNGGVNFDPVGTAPGGSILEFKFDPSDPRVMYVVQQSGVSKSSDGGVTWTALNFDAQPGTHFPRALFIDPALPSTLIVGNTAVGYGFMRSVDGGATWQSVRWQAVRPTLGGADFYAFDHNFGIVIAGGWGTGIHEYQIATDLAVESTAPTLPLGLGSTGTLNVLVRNLGPFHAAAPELQVFIPSNLTVTVPAGCTFNAPNLRCTLAAIRSGENRTMALAYTAANTPADSSFTASVLARETDLATANNSVAFNLSVARLAELQVTSTATASAELNGAVTYTATVRNNGPNDSPSTNYTLTLPAGVTGVTSTPSVGSCNTSGATLTCALGALANGASATVTVTGNGTTAGAQTWASSIVGPAGDTVPANNTASSTTTVNAPPPPPPGPPSPPRSSGGGGGSLDWLSAALLALLFAWRRQFAPSAGRRAGVSQIPAS